MHAFAGHHSLRKAPLVCGRPKAAAQCSGCAAPGGADDGVRRSCTYAARRCRAGHCPASSAGARAGCTQSLPCACSLVHGCEAPALPISSNEARLWGPGKSLACEWLAAYGGHQAVCKALLQQSQLHQILQQARQGHSNSMMQSLTHRVPAGGKEPQQGNRAELEAVDGRVSRVSTCCLLVLLLSHACGGSSILRCSAVQSSCLACPASTFACTNCFALISSQGAEQEAESAPAVQTQSEHFCRCETKERPRRQLWPEHSRTCRPGREAARLPTSPSCSRCLSELF